MRWHTALRLTFVALTCAQAARAQQEPTASTPDKGGYILGAQDVVAVTVFGHTELSGKFTISPDGSLLFPLVGSVNAAGRRPQDIQADLIERLSDGYLKSPKVSVEIEQYASQRVFVMGEVRTPGPIPLTGSMTLLEALARAGSLTEQAGGEIVLLRGSPDRPGNGPITQGQNGSSEAARISVQQLRRGVVANMELRNGDTIFVPRAETIFVLGLVNNPGTYTLEPGLTVLHAISLAGGTTPLGSTGRVRIVRVVEGQKRELNAKLDDIVKPGDTVVVRARIF
jgi:polysaccharide export outer membrane protein